MIVCICQNSPSPQKFKIMYITKSIDKPLGRSMLFHAVLFFKIKKNT